MRCVCGADAGCVLRLAVGQDLAALAVVHWSEYCSRRGFGVLWWLEGVCWLAVLRSAWIWRALMAGGGVLVGDLVVGVDWIRHVLEQDGSDALYLCMGAGVGADAKADAGSEMICWSGVRCVLWRGRHGSWIRN